MVMTGRYPSDRLVELADYVSRIDKVKHPFDKGIEQGQVSKANEDRKHQTGSDRNQEFRDHNRDFG